ncbi:MAG: response regulator transcription factor [Pseudomonadota bacterium]
MNQGTSMPVSEVELRAKGLLFGDEASQLGLMKSMLETYGYASKVLTNMAGVVKSMHEQPDFVIVLFGRNTPWPEAEQQLQLLRELHNRTPLILIAPCNDPETRQRIATANVEDFLCPPLKEGELATRLEVCLDRHRPEATSQGDYPCVERRHGERRNLAGDSLTLFQIDDRKKRVVVRGETLDLTPKEYALFSLLISDPGKVFSIKAIRDHLWPGGSNATASDVQQYIHRLRGKVEKDPTQPCCIQTVKGFGYRLADPHEQ